MKKYNGTAWVDTTLRQYKTATADIEPTIYTDGTAITTYTIKGNTVQNGTPTPTNPIAVNGVGELDSGDYKIPISNGQQTTDINIGTEQLNKVDTYTDMLSSNTLTKNTVTYTYKGDSSENWQLQSINSYGIANFYITMETPYQNIDSICSHLERQTTTIANTQTEGYFLSLNTPYNTFVRINSATADTVEKLKQWLSTQYANGTPLTFILALRTPTTTQITTPSISTTEGTNSITVDTTVQPSEFSATWTGWHNANVKEWDGSQWS